MGGDDDNDCDNGGGVDGCRGVAASRRHERRRSVLVIPGHRMKSYSSLKIGNRGIEAAMVVRFLPSQSLGRPCVRAGHLTRSGEPRRGLGEKAGNEAVLPTACCFP